MLRSMRLGFSLCACLAASTGFVASPWSSLRSCISRGTSTCSKLHASHVLRGGGMNMQAGGKDVLVTGGVGYIGSHTVVELLNSGYNVVVVDNLCNSNIECLSRVKEITGKEVTFYQVDLLDKAALDGVFEKHEVGCVIHFAGLKAVGESVAKPLLYYQNNIAGTLNLIEVMSNRQCKSIVFSSSATVYGEPKSVPVVETFPTGATNPYGRTKLFIEEILRDIHTADGDWNVVLLRYFNPVGAHPSGKIGEDPRGIPNNLMPFVQQVAVGRREQLTVFGSDYDTPDGTGVRDYIHVVDLATGHLAALRKIEQNPGCVVYNLGTGSGSSVLDVVNGFEKAAQKPIPYQLAERRPGDVATLYCDPAFAEQELGWKATLTLEDMCQDSWRWQSGNPNGYGGDESD